MDEVDRAQAAADRLAEHILADARRRNQQAVAAGEARPALRACVDCDDPIEAERLAVQPGAIRCTHCQRAAEGRSPARRPGVPA